MTKIAQVLRAATAHIEQSSVADAQSAGASWSADRIPIDPP
jgi:hypothetical protein